MQINVSHHICLLWVLIGINFKVKVDPTYYGPINATEQLISLSHIEYKHLFNSQEWRSNGHQMIWDDLLGLSDAQCAKVALQ